MKQESELRFIPYKKKYYLSCVELVRNTWNFHDRFEDITHINLIYEYYFKSCLNWNTHLEIIVDHQGHVKGLLFGSIENDSFVNEAKFKLLDVRLHQWLMKKINAGDFGNPQKAIEIIKSMGENDRKGEAYAYLFDSEINLFIVSSELRGMGLGRELMDHYIDFCCRKHLKRSFLWTDQGCSYNFYEKYGFKLHSMFSENNSSVMNTGMIYYYDVL